MERQSNIPTLRVLKMLDRIVDETDEDLRAYELSRIHDYLAMKFNRETGKLASEELKSL
ncbi:hypothetical protein OAC75_01235 [Pseudomonadales bacterium]|jgi:hypothetical protein|nr:hypothetical protein [Pseudomonadales bacterium]